MNTLQVPIDLTEAKRRVHQLLAEDPCLAAAATFCAALEEKDAGARVALESSIARHEQACGGNCLRNLRVAAETVTDPFKRDVYLQITTEFMHSWLVMQGCATQVESRPDGNVYRSTFSDKFSTPTPRPFITVECFRPFDRSQEAHVTFDLVSQDLFQDPRPFIDYLDRRAANEVQAFPLDAPALHWRAIIGEDQWTLRVRWQGQVKVLAEDWGLHARYARLVRKHRVRERSWVDTADGRGRMGPEEPGEEALKLRDLALKYNEEKSWFAGFLEVNLGYKKIDELRHREIDAENFSVSIDAPRPPHHGLEAEGESSALDPMESWLQRDPRLRPGNALEQAIRSNLRDHLLAALSPIQGKIFYLKIQGLTDAEIGVHLGLRRETVNRHLGRIREQGLRLLN